MESLYLPQDLFWDGKMEPISPYSSDLFSLSNSEDPWLLEDNFANDDLPLDEDSKTDSENSPMNGELLYEFEYDVKEEQWINGKSSSHQIMDYPSNVLSPQPAQVIKVQNPLEIIMELEKIYDAAELTQLTPPQTPPQDCREIKEIFDLISQQEQHQENPCSQVVNKNYVVDDIIPAMSPATSNAGYSSDSIHSPLSSDIAREMQIVDEIIRTKSQELPDWNDDDSMYSSMSSSLSPHSNDDEWSPSSPSTSTSPAPGKMVTKGNLTKRRTRPYGRGTEDRKSRKKEQNKNAATRYRQKKKLEMKEVLDEERLLVDRNEELSKNVSDIEREIKYLKQLIREFYKNKESSKK